MKIKFEVIGCDDETVFVIESLEEKEVLLLEKIAMRTKELSSYSCMPVIEVHRCHHE